MRASHVTLIAIGLLVALALVWRTRQTQAPTETPVADERAVVDPDDHLAPHGDETLPPLAGPHATRCTQLCARVDARCDPDLFAGSSCAHACVEALDDDPDRLEDFACLGVRCDTDRCGISSAMPAPVDPAPCEAFCAAMSRCELTPRLPTEDPQDCVPACVGLQRAGAHGATALRCAVARLDEDACRPDHLEGCFTLDAASACDDVCQLGARCAEGSAFQATFGDVEGCVAACAAREHLDALVAFGACLENTSCAGAARCAALPDEAAPACEPICEAVLDHCAWSLDGVIQPLEACRGTCAFYDALGIADVDGALARVAGWDACPEADTDLPPALAAVALAVISPDPLCQQACDAQRRCYESPVRWCVPRCTLHKATDPGFATFMDACMQQASGCGAAPCLGH